MSESKLNRIKGLVFVNGVNKGKNVGVVKIDQFGSMIEGYNSEGEKVYRESVHDHSFNSKRHFKNGIEIYRESAF